MTDYNDIAQRNPLGAEQVINSFGYEIIDRRNLGKSLNELVILKGEPALKKIMEIHPDKDIILELFSEKKPEKKPCSCGGNCGIHNKESYLNATGAEAKAPKDNSNVLAHQTNAILVVATLFIVTALILNKK